jgi:hypothetical protein
MDIASIGSLLSSLKTATDIAKFIRESDISIEKAETKLKLAELVSALADAKLEAAEIQQVLLDRDEEIRRLTASAKLHVELRWNQPCYFLKNSDGSEDAYCQNCYDGEKKLSRLHTDRRGYFYCHVCKHSYKTQERSEREAEAANAAIRNRGGGWMAR